MGPLVLYQDDLGDLQTHLQLPLVPLFAIDIARSFFASIVLEHGIFWAKSPLDFP